MKVRAANGRLYNPHEPKSPHLMTFEEIRGWLTELGTIRD
jgi:hypothetical protein